MGSAGSLTPGPNPELTPLPALKGAAPGTSQGPAAEGSLSLAPRFGAGIFVGCEVSLGMWEPPLRSAGASGCRQLSILPAALLSAPFQTSPILSNPWFTMKSFQFDAQSVWSSSWSCAIPSSLFWNLVFGVFLGTSVSQMCPFHKGNSGPRTEDPPLCLPALPPPRQRS